jgi:hypothetical protein
MPVIDVRPAGGAPPARAAVLPAAALAVAWAGGVWL